MPIDSKFVLDTVLNNIHDITEIDSVIFTFYCEEDPIKVFSCELFNQVFVEPIKVSTGWRSFYTSKDMLIQIYHDVWFHKPRLPRFNVKMRVSLDVIIKICELLHIDPLESTANKCYFFNLKMLGLSIPDVFLDALKRACTSVNDKFPEMQLQVCAMELFEKIYESKRSTESETNPNL